MKNILKKHFGYYFLLFLLLFLGLIATVFAAPNIKLQSFIILITIILYVMLGIIHHLLNHELTAKIVIEYLLIGFLGSSILFFVIEGGL